MLPRIQLLLIASMIALACQSPAATWRVELDGSGDFTTIQDAIDAAAPGDSILVGAGEFVDTRAIELWPGRRSTATVVTSGLVIRGAGAEETIVGEDSGDGYYYPFFAPTAPNDISSLTICDLTVRGGYIGVNYESHGLKLERCCIRGSTIGVLAFHSHGGEIVDCDFAGHEIGAAIVSSPVEWAISGSTFFQCSTGMILQACAAVAVSHCRTEGCNVGIQFDGSCGTIHATEVFGAPGITNGDGVECLAGSRVAMTDCVIDYSMATTFAALYVIGQEFSAYGCQFRNGGRATIHINGHPGRQLEFNDNEIGKAAQFALVLEEYSHDGVLSYYDFTNNDWGTTNSDSIAAWIDDAEDHPDSHLYQAVAKYIPFVGSDPTHATPGPEMHLQLTCHPNPFNPHTQINYVIERAGHVKLEVYDLRGRVVRVLVDGTLPSGSGSAGWDGRDGTGREAPSGVYFSRLSAGGRSVLGKMMLVR